ncbi:MAG: hypothetical protein LBR84_09465, partial [Tannerella sp.]|nr:hypothetical protein [Tannerella sp.]
MKMKRIALALLTGIVLLASCNNDKPVPGVDPNPTDPTDPRSSKGRISLQILVPMSGVKTYAGEAASTLENRIDTVYVDLYQGGGTPINQSKFYGTDLAIAAGTNDSILTVGYEVDNIATGTLTVKVYANRKDVKTITGEIPTPDGTPSKSFFMSGEATLTGSGPYSGVVHLVRDVAKLRVNVSLNSVYFPSDMTIDYANIKIEAIQVPNQTSLFGPTADAAAGQSGFAYINYAERTVRINPGTSGGMVDSMYLNENIRSSYTTGTMTKIKLTIPTISATEGAKTDSYTFDLYTDGKYDILRNYIYTLDIKVRGQSLEPVITLNVLPWDDVSVDGNIYGTYLTTNTSEIEFDSNGEAWIEFCTDAQAVYFDFSEFNANNDVAVGPEDGAYSEIIGKGISEADPALAPNGFIDGQILLDHQHCGRFGFKLDDNPSLIANFPTFPQLNFTGKICIKAGNVVKCLFFPARRAYDAHFIVGDTLLSGEMFTYAETYGGSWIEVSPDRKYTTNAGTTYSGAAARLYLHLDENLTGVTRTGSVLA